MRFRPCIDIHDGQVKQIVGGTLNNTGAVENFVSKKGADYFASLYKENSLPGGHIIMLNKRGSDEYELSKAQAMKGLKAYPGGMQIGGGITDENAGEFINAGASHVIVTSFVFSDGSINEDNLQKISKAAGKDKLVIDLSCRRVKDGYVIATDRWQKLTKVNITYDTLDYFAGFCDEFLIHAVDVEGKQNGIEQSLLEYLSGWDGITITYAGGVRSVDDMRLIRDIGKSRIDVTVGSALDLFGGNLRFKDAVDVCKS